MIFMPGLDERLDIHEFTTTVDLLPTLLQLSGKPLLDGLEGVILPPFNPQVQEDRSIFSVDFRYVPKFKPLRNGSIMLRKGSHKLSFLFGKYKRYDNLENGKLLELYNVEDDPEELVNLYHPQFEPAISMRDEILAKIDQIGLELPIEM
jgi:arylsulfatase A-like enzyme